MDRLRISENQKSVFITKKKPLRFLSLILCFCFLFLVSCVKQTDKTQDLKADVSTKVQTFISQTTLAETTVAKESESNERAKKETTTLSDKKKAETTNKKADETSTSVTTKKSAAKPSKTVSHSSKAAAATTSSNEKYCYLSIECKTVLDNLQKLDPAKTGVVPSDGIILKKTKVSFSNGESVYDVFKRVCQNNVCTHKCSYCKNRIQFESIISDFGSVYIRGIHFLYEKDCGTHSGWMYRVNGVFPNKAVDEYDVRENDLIEFVYTCNLNDTGSSF